MLKQILFDDKYMVHIRTTDEWEHFKHLCDCYGIDIYNRNAFKEGWILFGVSAFSAIICGQGKTLSDIENRGEKAIKIDALLLMLDDCDDDAEINMEEII